MGGFLAGFATPVSAMQVLDDQTLGEETGQAAFYTSYGAPSGTGSGTNSSDFGFYTLGVQGKVDINTNIQHLQLGCGGVNGPGCDIDINNLSLSGNPGTGTCASGAARASCDATLTNPFLRLAIKNPTTLATREVVGLQLGAQNVTGLLTAGTENSTTPNGINSLSGYMSVAASSGTATTAARSMTYADTGNQAINGQVKGSLLTNSCGGFLDPCINVSYSSTNYTLNLSSATAPLTTNATVVNGKRLSSIGLTGTANVGQIDFAGPLTATVAGFLNLNKQVTGNITGLIADLTIQENLGFVHSIPLNNPFSLSLQKQDVMWPGAPAVAQTGWWMAFNDPINIGNVTPSSQVQITNAVLAQVIPKISTYLTNNPTNCGNLLTGCVGGSDLAVGNVALTNAHVAFPLTDLQLAAQSFPPNCYGSLKFC
ncbi:hypothetical protein [Aquirhabdus parva]|uniref:Uncharacterized protein n=1 Tax=Aquirhabdus parva TaxID=2283318 RepID=A0A345P3K2_9GAMM|nr:hypothetical protein [Aquirhabdus parva]AXI01861.1 hypothetical protein HYN46_02580 [Aquirhabdus parva]